MKRLVAFLAAIIATASLAATSDPPGRVGRVSFLNGEVTLFADPELGWEKAYVNSPVTSENSLWTEPRANVEVRVGSLALRLDELTQLDVARLDDEVLRAHLARGRLAIRVRFLEGNESITLSTADARFQLRTDGRYRLDSDPDRAESRLTVFSGSARLEAAGGFVPVEDGRSVRVTGGAHPSYAIEPARSTAFDEWSLARDDYIAQVQPSRYVPPAMTGWEDLETYGEWRNEPEYGTVWFPLRVEAGWVPYRHGRWAWVRPWGWTWVDDAPWGYAPFHYGRWVHVQGRWGWYPGTYTPRPVWAPALVAWVGGPGWSVSVGTRGPTNVIGWYPLSPYDRYEPWYPANVTYVNRINHVTIVTRPGHERRPGSESHPNRDAGATVVVRDNFAARRPIQGNVARIPGEVIRSQPLTHGSAVLPPRSEIRPHPGQPQGRPDNASRRPPVGGSSPSAGAPAASTPSARPMPAPQTAPSAPSTSRTAQPPQSPDRPLPADRATPAERAAPSGSTRPIEGSAARPRPAEPAQVRSKPAENAPGSAAPSPARAAQEPPSAQRQAPRESHEHRGATPASAPSSAPTSAPRSAPSPSSAPAPAPRAAPPPAPAAAPASAPTTAPSQPSQPAAKPVKPEPVADKESSRPGQTQK